MRYPRARLSALPALLVLGSLPAFAQVSSTSDAKTASENNRSAPPADQAVVLSPFEVNTNRDVGFVAASALAGGRLNLDLNDVPASYSVITRDFIDAVGITNLYDASEWTTNTYKTVDTTGNGDLFGTTANVTVRGVNNVWGLRQRNWFMYAAPMDSYSIERYDFGRGPNQILFGNGTVGGQSVSMTKRARFDRPFETIKLQAGSWSNYRTELDINRPITKNLSVRVAAVSADRKGWRMHESESTKAIFGTATYKPWHNAEIRLEGESGHQSRRIPFTEIFDNFSGWDGTTVFNGLLTSIPSTASAHGYSRLGSNYYLYNYAADNGTLYQYQNQPVTLGGNQSASTPIGGFTQVGTQSLNTNGADMLYANDVPANRFATAIANSAFRMPSREWNVAPPTSAITQHFKDAQLTFSQQVGDDLFVEVAGDMNRVYNFRDMVENGGARNTMIDITRLLPNGQPNPFFLQPYADITYRHAWNTLNNDQGRYAVAWVHDYGKWGNYSATLQGGLSHSWGVTRNSFLLPGTQPTAGDNRTFGNPSPSLRYRQYWSQPATEPGVPSAISYVDPNNAANDTTLHPFWGTANDTFNNLNDQSARYNYTMAALNAKYFKGRLVLLGAVRRDDSRQNVYYTRVSGDYPLDWDKHTPMFRPDAPADWATLMYTPKDATGKALGPPTLAVSRPRINNSQYQSGQPQYANDRFQDDYNPPAAVVKSNTPSIGGTLHVARWLALSYNYAKSFAFNGSAAPDPYGQLMPPAKGQGYDLRARFSFSRRFDFSAGYYANTEVGNYIDPTSVTNQINTLYNANAVGDLSDAGRNIRGATNMSSVTRDTRTRITNGYEFELTANPMPGVRLMANYALKPKVWNLNYAPITRRYVAEHADLFKQILQDAGGMVGADGRAVADPSVPAANAPDQASAVNAYNNIYTNLGSFLPDLQLDNAQDTGNIFADYTIQTGKARGLRFGAGINYRGRRRVGYRNGDTIVNPANPLTSIDDPTVDGHTTVWAPSYYIATVTASYRYQVAARRSVRFDLRVANALNNRDPIWVGTTLRPRGGDYTSPARESVLNGFAYQTPFNVQFTVTLEL